MSERSRAELEAEITRLEKVNRVLVKRVQRSINSAGSEFGMFEQNIHLDRLVEERTAELRSRNADLEAARARAEAATQAKGRFLANMSHELRTPLNAVIGVVQLLGDTRLDEGQSEYLGILSQASGHLLGLINDILDFTRADSGQLPLKPAPMQPRALVAEVLDSLRCMPGTEGLTLSAEIAPSVPAGIVADPRRLQQVLVNLVGNACKFTDSGSVSVQVHRQGAMLVFAIEDTGIGIDEDTLSTIFERFAQADSGDSRRHGGTGLGLAICQQLVGLWGGEISVVSVPGKGTCVSFSLPCETIALTEPRQPAPGPAAGAAGARILLVDDHPINRLVARRLLEQLGAEVTEASSGAHAIKLLDGAAPDLILMDCQMPGIDGFEATRRIRQGRSDRARTPIVALTASVLEEDYRQCLDAGMDAHLPKPVQREALAALLSTWCPRTG